MKPNDLFNHIWRTPYRKSGFDVDWNVEIDEAEKKIRLLFAPSNSIQDWIVNIAGFIPVPKFFLFYCFGWKSVFDSIKSLILEEVIHEVNQHPDHIIEICGHSYGGAMSIIAAIEIFKKTKIKCNVITFGSPMPLFFLYSKLIAKLCCGKVEQYAHRSDIVTYCPPFPFYHNVKVIRIGKFNLKDLFMPSVYHMIYDDESLYE